MHKVLIAYLVLLITCVSTLAQSPDGDGWIRVQSDDGAISVEVPSITVLFANEGGFIETTMNGGGSYHLNDMKMLSAYADGTLVILESYRSTKAALETVYDNEISGKAEKTTIKKPAYSIKQAVIKNERTAMIRQFFAFRDRIYILTTASRGSITPHMTRFLSSVEVNTDKDTSPKPQMRTFATLPRKEPVVELQLDANGDTPQPLPRPTSPVKDDPSVKRYEVLHHPRPAYVEPARSKNVTGRILVKITLDAQGYVPRIVVRKTLPEGLLRQVLIAAVRIKFLPKEKDGHPVGIIVTREYSFDIY